MVGAPALVGWWTSLLARGDGGRGMKKKKFQAGSIARPVAKAWSSPIPNAWLFFFLHFFLLTSRRFGPHQPVTELTNSDQ